MNKQARWHLQKTYMSTPSHPSTIQHGRVGWASLPEAACLFPHLLSGPSNSLRCGWVPQYCWVTKGAACLSVSVGLSSFTLTTASLLRDHQGSSSLVHKANIENQSISDHTSRHNAMHEWMNEYKSVGLQHNNSITEQHTMCPIPMRERSSWARLHPARADEHCARKMPRWAKPSPAWLLCLFRVQRA